MPKSLNTIQFSLPSRELEKLQGLANEGESMGLVAKRILLDALGSPIDKPIGNDKLEALESRIEAIEQAMASLKATDNTVDNFIGNDTSKMADEKNLAARENLSQSDRAIALQNKFCVVSLNGEKEIEKFWSGREWSEDLSKAKIFESDRGATASVKSLKSKGYKNVAFNSCDRIIEKLDESRKAIANLYWIKEND